MSETSQRSFGQRFRSSPLGICAASFLGLVIVACVFARWIAPYSYDEEDLTRVLSGPSAHHLLGTDSLGRDVLSRLLFGGQVSLLGTVEALAVFVLVGLPIGLAVGYFGGRLDAVVGWLSDVALALPAIIVILVVVAVFDQSNTAAMVAFGVIAAPGLMRVTRAATLAVRKQLYVTAARVGGLSDAQILRRHVLPRIAGPVLVQVTLFAATTLLLQTGLGFLGLDATPPRPSWGGLVADAADEVVAQPWLLIPTGGTIVLTVLALGLLGDVIREAATSRTSTSAKRVRVPSLRGVATAVTEPMEQDPPVLRVRGMTVSFATYEGSVAVVENVSLEVHRGEILGIVGESGCGKSVTARSILGLLPPAGAVTAGQILFGGLDLATSSQKALRAVRGKRIAMVSQDPMQSLDPCFTVGSLLREAVRTHWGERGRTARARVRRLLEMVQFGEPEVIAKSYPHELSGGMAQRALIALALVAEPELLIADEPTTALDVTVQAEILDLLRQLAAASNMAVILVSHDWGVIADLCDRALVMYAGQIVEEARTEDLITRPEHPYTSGLLAADPHHAAFGARLPSIEGSVPSPESRPSGCRFAPRCPYATADCETTIRDPLVVGPYRRTLCIHPDRVPLPVTHHV